MQEELEKCYSQTILIFFSMDHRSIFSILFYFQTILIFSIFKYFSKNITLRSREGIGSHELMKPPLDMPVANGFNPL